MEGEILVGMGDRRGVEVGESLEEEERVPRGLCAERGKFPFRARRRRKFRKLGAGCQKKALSGNCMNRESHLSGQDEICPG